VDQSSRVPKPAHGRFLIDYLVERFPYFDRHAWAERIAEQRLTLDGELATGDQKLQKGQTLTYRMPDYQEPPADLNWSVAAEDDHFLVTVKPGNLLVHRQGKAYMSNLVYLVRNAGNPAWMAADPAHRIDRETSGLVLFAKDKAALRAVLELFETRQVTKEYWAIVAPHAGARVPREGEEGTIDLPIGRTEDAVRGPYQAVGVPGARASVTTWVWGAEVSPGHHLVIARPETGRTHQIRVHLAAQGWPLVGDKLYGGPPASRHALHARSLGFVHPVSGLDVRYEAPLPADWAGLL